MNPRQTAGTSPLAGDKVFLVDDDAPIRRALSRVLRGAGFDVATFATAQDLLGALQPQPGPWCLVADLRMPGLDGLGLQQELRHRSIELPIIFISGRADVDSGVRAMKDGAVDFLEKPIAANVLRDAIRGALEQDRQHRARLVEQAELRARAATLTPRELEVFALVVTGRLNKQVGAELGATEKTIQVHRSRVMEKMQADSLAGLVRMADRIGLTYESVRRHPPDTRPGA